MGPRTSYSPTPFLLSSGGYGLLLAGAAPATFDLRHEGRGCYRGRVMAPEFRAVACALEMQLALTDCDAEQRRRRLPELTMGIGINMGEVIVGNIGSEQRAKYGAVGSAINMAYRIESYTIGGQLLVSPDTYERVRALVRVRGTVTAQFKGVDRAITLYDVSGLGGDYQLSLPETTPAVLATLQRPLPVACFPIEGKTVSTIAAPGTLVRLGSTAADLVLEVPVAGHANLKIVLDPASASKPCELYAKVLAFGGKGDALGTAVRVGFTSVSDDAKAVLDERRISRRRLGPTRVIRPVGACGGGAPGALSAWPSRQPLRCGTSGRCPAPYASRRMRAAGPDPFWILGWVHRSRP